MATCHHVLFPGAEKTFSPVVEVRASEQSFDSQFLPPLPR